MSQISIYGKLYLLHLLKSVMKNLDVNLKLGRKISSLEEHIQQFGKQTHLEINDLSSNLPGTPIPILTGTLTPPPQGPKRAVFPKPIPPPVLSISGSDTALFPSALAYALVPALVPALTPTPWHPADSPVKADSG